jgi:hypothetical protein
MPMVGVKCDDPEHYGLKVPFEDCINCAIAGGPRRCHTPYPLLVDMAKKQHGRKDAGLSATMVLDACPRRVVLSLGEEYYEHPDDYLARFNGTLWHTAMEEHDSPREDIVEEVRFRKSYPVEVDGEVVWFYLTGKPDHINKPRRLIIDYKTCESVFAKPVSIGQPKDGHEPQLNIYLDLVDGGTAIKTGEVVHIPIEHAGIIYISPNKRKPKNPAGEVMTRFRKVPVRVWSPDERLAYIQRVAYPIVAATARGDLPPVLYEPNGNRSWRCASKLCALREVCDAHAAAGR